MKPVLEVRSLEKSFGGIHAVRRLDFDVCPGQIKAIIGPNGAGKTTVFNLITGIYPPTGGQIRFKGDLIHHLPPYAIAAKGISRTFQLVQLFENMTVLENVMVGRHCRTKAGMVRVALRSLHARKEEKTIMQDAMANLEFVGLATKATELISNIPFKERRLLEFARALATGPELLLIDEPAAGLNVHETREIANLIYKIRDSGITVLLIEHDMSLVMDISEEVLVLNYGQKIAEGPPAEVQKNQEVIAVYLGEETGIA